MHAQIDHALIRTSVAWPLRIMIAIIVFIAGFGLLSAWALSLSAAQLDRGLRGQMTVEIAPDDNGRIDPALTAALIRQVQALPGVTAVKPLPPAQVAELLRPWLGKNMPDAESLALLPLPQLIDIHVADPAATPGIATMLQKQFPAAALADHRQWVQQLAQQARWAAIALLAIVGVLLAALFSTVVFACRAGLNVQLPTVTLLHIIGATDNHICSQMRRYAWRLVWPGCLLGMLACGGASLLLIHLIAIVTPGAYSPAQDVFWIGAGALAVCLPLLALLFARLSANFATRRVLRAMP